MRWFVDGMVWVVDTGWESIGGVGCAGGVLAD